MFEQERLRGDGAYATGAEQLCAGDHQVNGEDEDFAHRANGTITAGAFKTARRRRIGSHYEFAPDRFSIAEDIGSKRAGIAHLSGASELAVFFGEWNLAARLYGAAEAQRERIGHHPEPREEVFIERAREALGAIAFAAAESDGRSLSYDEAIAQARAWLDEGS